MAGSSLPRVVVVTRPTDFERLLALHGTRGQADFFLRTRAQSIGPVEDRHRAFAAVLASVLNAIPVEWRRARVDRADLDRFLFEPEDVVVAVGQDGLVANVAKYLAGQVVVGLNPAPGEYPGVLVPHPPSAAPELLRIAVSGRGECEERTMVEAVLDDGQRLVALNEVFVGHRTHQSARYRLAFGQASERHSSSGLIAATGTGATGWALSIRRERAREIALPAPVSGEIVFFVREAWPSKATGATLTQGSVAPGQAMEVVSEMDEGGVVFGDGIETDRLEFSYGRRVTVRAAADRLRLLKG
jgi:hypothetical protein